MASRILIAGFELSWNQWIIRSDAILKHKKARLNKRNNVPAKLDLIVAYKLRQNNLTHPVYKNCNKNGQRASLNSASLINSKLWFIIFNWFCGRNAILGILFVKKKKIFSKKFLSSRSPMLSFLPLPPPPFSLQYFHRWTFPIAADQLKTN